MSVKKPWRSAKIDTMGQAPRPRYDHCAEFIASQGNLIIYGGRNYDLFEISGKISMGDIFVLNLNFLVWCNVKIISGRAIERFDFISFQHGKKCINSF